MSKVNVTWTMELSDVPKEVLRRLEEVTTDLHIGLDLREVKDNIQDDDISLAIHQMDKVRDHLSSLYDHVVEFHNILSQYQLETAQRQVEKAREGLEVVPQEPMTEDEVTEVPSVEKEEKQAK